MNTPRRSRQPAPLSSARASKPSLGSRITERLRGLRGRRTPVAAPVRVPTSPRGLEATASRLPTRYTPPRRVPDRKPTRLFIFVSVLIGVVLLLGSIFVVIPQPLPPDPLATSNEALRARRLPLLAFAGPTLVQASDDGMSALSEAGTPTSGLSAPAETSLTAFAISPTDSSIRYAAGLTLGITRSTDNGNTWQAVLPGAPTLPEGGALPLSGHLITSLTIDPTNAERVVAWSAGRGLLMSTDGGATWQFASSGGGDVPLTALAFTGSEGVVLWAGGSQGLYRSEGASFSSVPEADQIGAIAALAPLADGSLVAASGDRALWTSPDGATWEKLGSIAPRASVTSLASDPSVANRLWASTDDGRLWRSEDGGRDWAAV